MNKVALTIAGIASLVVAAASPFAFQRFFEVKTEEAASSWMTNLEDNRPVSLLSIPGSHDSGALHSIADIAGICQDLSIKEQLKSGVRFFDIRLRGTHDSLLLCHGYIDQKIKFGEIRNEFSSFLKEHPGEGLFVSIKEEQEISGCSKTFEELLKEQIEQDDYWLLDNKIPHRLADIRGKAVLLSRYASPTIGIKADAGWQDPGQAEAANTFTIEVGEGTLRVQDHYQLKDIETKKNEFAALLQETNSYNEAAWALDVAAGHQKLFVNFASGYLEGKIPPSYSLSVSPEMNQFVKNSVKEIRNAGIVLLDFAAPDLCKSIYEVNAR